MKSYTIFFALLFVTLSSAFSQESDSCLLSLRKGKFTYEGKSGEVTIIRTKNRQEEIFNGGRSKLIMKIKWINNSTYVLTHIKSVNAPGNMKKGDKIFCSIPQCEGDHYTVRYTSVYGAGQSVFIKLE